MGELKPQYTNTVTIPGVTEKQEAGGSACTWSVKFTHSKVWFLTCASHILVLQRTWRKEQDFSKRNYSELSLL